MNENKKPNVVDFGRNIALGASPLESAQAAGFPTLREAQMALNYEEFKRDLKGALQTIGFTLDFYLQEIRWGLKNTKSEKQFMAHTKYLSLMFDIYSKAYPENDSATKGTQKNYEKFIAFIKQEFSQKDAEVVMDAMSKYQRIHDSETR